MTTATAESNSTPPKLGGWLTVLLVYLVSRPVFFTVYHVGSALSSSDQYITYSRDTSLDYGRLAMEVSYVLYAGACAIMLYKRRWNAVSHMQQFMLAGVSVYIVSAFVISDRTPSIIGVLWALSGPLGWYAYLRFSKRVETTFPTDPFVMRVTAGRSE